MTKKKLHHDLMKWPGHFTHALVLAIAISIAAMFNSYLSAAGIIIMGSLGASAVILTHKHKHHLTTLGTITFSYFIATFLAIGVAIILRMLNAPLESKLIISIVVIGFSLFWLGIFHPPALAFGVAFMVFERTTSGYLIVFCAAIVCFVLIRMLIYMFYEHLSLKQFVNELIKEEEELILKEERKILGRRKTIKKKR